MITRTVLRNLARARLADAEVLFERKRYHGAYYLCGYAMEFVLKARICVTLGWTEFPEGDKFRGFKVHDLDTLLRLSGSEKRIKDNNKTGGAWFEVKKWQPELRYSKLSSVKRKHAAEIIRATRLLLSVLLCG